MIIDPDNHRSGGAPAAGEPPAPAVRVRGLRRTYGQGPSAYEAVRGVDLDVPAGSITALLGTNGAGKTSTLEVIEGLAPATDGEVSVLGLDPVADRAVLRRRTGVLLQRSGFSGDLTVRETLRLWSATLTSPAPGRRDARAAVARGAGRRAHARPVRRRDPPGRPRLHADGQPRAGDPRRAHDRPRPREPARGVAARVRPARRRRHGAHHDALPRGGRGARRPAGDHARRPDRPLGDAHRDRGGAPVDDQLRARPRRARRPRRHPPRRPGARAHDPGDRRAAELAVRPAGLGRAQRGRARRSRRAQPEPRARVPLDRRRPRARPAAPPEPTVTDEEGALR